MKAWLLGIALLCGCSSHTAWRVSAGTPPPPSAPASAHVSSSSGIAVLLGLTIVTLGAYEAAAGGLGFAEGDARRPPEMAPERRVSEQDCTKPIDYTLGNIRCK